MNTPTVFRALLDALASSKEGGDMPLEPLMREIERVLESFPEDAPAQPIVFIASIRANQINVGCPGVTQKTEPEKAETS